MDWLVISLVFFLLVPASSVWHLYHVFQCCVCSCLVWREVYIFIYVIRLMDYVDDMLIIESNEVVVQELMDIIRVLGLEYCMHFNESEL